jgi:hypothetical protein
MTSSDILLSTRTVYRVKNSTGSEWLIAARSVGEAERAYELRPIRGKRGDVVSVSTIGEVLFDLEENA